jgi:hypothetical protein
LGLRGEAGGEEGKEEAHGNTVVQVGERRGRDTEVECACLRAS